MLVGRYDVTSILTVTSDSAYQPCSCDSADHDGHNSTDRNAYKQPRIDLVGREAWDTVANLFVEPGMADIWKFIPTSDWKMKYNCWINSACANTTRKNKVRGVIYVSGGQHHDLVPATVETPFGMTSKPRQ